MVPVLARSWPSTQRVIRLIAWVLAVLPLSGCRQNPPATKSLSATDGLIVTADGVLCDLGRTLAQSAARVVCLVAPGEDPHDLRLTPKQRQQLASAKRVYVTGYGLTPALANWPGTRPVAERAVPQSPLLDPERQIRDPHVWHDLRQSQAMVSWLANDLTQVLPQQAAAIARRSKTMVGLLEELDQWNRVQFATIPQRRDGHPPVIATDHRGLASLARAYGLQEHAVVDGHSTSFSLRPQSLSQALQWLRQQHPRLLFSETLPPSRALQRLSTLSGIPIATRAVVVDGLAVDAPSLPATTSANTCVVSEGLGGRCDRRSARSIEARWSAIR